MPTVFARALLLGTLLLACIPIAAGATVSVLQQAKIPGLDGRFPSPLHDHDWFGFSVDSLGDFDHDSVPDLVVGAGFDDDGGIDRGAVWIVPLLADGSAKYGKKISSTAGGFDGPLHDGDVFGRTVASLGDLDGDGVTDLAVGARQDDDGGPDRGAVWILFLAADGSVKSHAKTSSTAGGLTDPLVDHGWFGISVSRVGDLDGDGHPELVVGQIFDNGGVAWILFLDADGSVKQSRRIAGSDFGATNLFGEAVSGIGDLDGDGVADIAVAELEDNDGGSDRGAVWIVFLNADGTRKGEQKISSSAGGFTGHLDDGDHLGAAVAGVGDLDGDGVRDLAVGCDLDDDGGANRGAVWLMFLNTDGTVKDHAKISQVEGNFGGALQNEDRLGRAVTSLGDLDGDAKTDLAIGAIFDDNGDGSGTDRGAVWITRLDAEPVGTTTTTLPPLCGDGILARSEACDDGDTIHLRGEACDDACRRVRCGDTDGTDAVTIGDARYALGAAIGNRPCDLEICDVTGDAQVTTTDALQLLRWSVHLSTAFNCPL